jgi:hypothetical protein
VEISGRFAGVTGNNLFQHPATGFCFHDSDESFPENNGIFGTKYD